MTRKQANELARLIDDLIDAKMPSHIDIHSGGSALQDLTDGLMKTFNPDPKAKPKADLPGRFKTNYNIVNEDEGDECPD
jgi:hypothetical protein